MPTGAKRAARTEATAQEAARQLVRSVAKFTPAHQVLIRGARQRLRRRFPTATELVYDNYNFFVIGYSPTERPSHAIVSIVASAKGVSLCFIQGAHLPDPDSRLLGAGTQTRFIRLPALSVLDQPEITALLDAATRESDVPFPADGRGRLIIKSISARQRPRRLPTK